MRSTQAPNELTLRGALSLLARGAITSEFLVEALLDAIRRRDPKLRGYLEVDESDALRQARAADRMRADGFEGALLGVPIAVKDCINVEGQTCRCGSRILEGYRSAYDSTAVSRLRSAGALIVGRTNMDEFAMGSSTENSAFAITRNPWDLDRVPGGSSGGSAAVVAADEALAALGSDTGGSARVPASFCGCVGISPTYGRVSRYGLTSFAPSLDQIGPVAKDVPDAAFLLGVISGYDENDATSEKVPVPDFQSALLRGVGGMKFGVPKECFSGDISLETERAVKEAMRCFEELGAKVVEVSLPIFSQAFAAYYTIACAEASSNLARFDGVRYGVRSKSSGDMREMYTRTRSEFFGAEVKLRMMLGAYVLSGGHYEEYYLRACEARQMISAGFKGVLRECDAILTPTTPTEAFRIGEKSSDFWKICLSDVFTACVNLAGICAISVPCGFAGGNLPVGLQIIGPPFGEETVLSAAAAYERLTDWSSCKQGNIE